RRHRIVGVRDAPPTVDDDELIANAFEHALEILARGARLGAQRLLQTRRHARRLLARLAFGKVLAHLVLPAARAQRGLDRAHQHRAARRPLDPGGVADGAEYLGAVAGIRSFVTQDDD